MTDNRELAERLRLAAAQLQGMVASPTPSEAERARRRGRTIRRRRRAGAAILGSLAILAIALPLAALSPLGHGDRPGEPTGPSGSATLGFESPPGWEYRVGYPQDSLGPSLDATTFPLPSETADRYKATFVDMPAGGIAFRLQEFVGICGCDGFDDRSTPPTLMRSDLIDWGMHRYAAATFRIGDVYFDLYVEFGSNPVSDDDLSRANDALAAVRIDPSREPISIVTDGWTAAPTIQPEEGWAIASLGSTVGSGGSMPYSWASNVPFQAQDLLFVARDGGWSWPGATMKQMPTSGIVIVAGTASDPSYTSLPHRSLPLQLADFEVQHAWEGQVAPNVPQYVLWSWVRQRFLEVRIFFGRQDPTQEQLASAQAMLDGISPGDLPGDTTETNVDEGFTVTYPDDWTVAREVLTPTLSDPREILALGTYPLRPGGPSCAQFPVNAIEDLGPDDALIWLAERNGEGGATPRPADPQSWLDTVPDDESPACLSAPKDFSHHAGEFSDAGRTFQIYVAYGSSASTNTLSELWGIVNSLTFTRNPGA